MEVCLCWCAVLLDVRGVISETGSAWNEKVVCTSCTGLVPFQSSRLLKKHEAPTHYHKDSSECLKCKKAPKKLRAFNLEIRGR